MGAVKTVITTLRVITEKGSECFGNGNLDFKDGLEQRRTGEKNCRKGKRKEKGYPATFKPDYCLDRQLRWSRHCKRMNDTSDSTYSRGRFHRYIKDKDNVSRIRFHLPHSTRLPGLGRKDVHMSFYLHI